MRPQRVWFENGELRSKNYRTFRYLKWPPKPSYRNFLTGVGGVLYPPHSLPKEIFNSKVFMDIAETVDDVWLRLMAVLGGTKTMGNSYNFLYKIHFFGDFRYLCL